ncbi:MAG: flagellar biosynthesis regulator FlaF [Pseudomonadota bacterium]
MRGYAENADSTRHMRRMEYDAIARATSTLREKAMSSKSDFPGYADALLLNQKLWTALVVDLLDKRNPLPDELKGSLMYLGEFTRQHTSKILRENASVMPLLEINMAVMRGLKNEGPTQ